MRILGGIAVCALIVAILWRPESRAVPAWITLALLLVCALVLTACVRQRAPTEVFESAQCTFADTGEWRTRRERGSCIARTPKHTVNGHTSGGDCTAWSQNTIHEKRQAVNCYKQRWARR